MKKAWSRLTYLTTLIFLLVHFLYKGKNILTTAQGQNQTNFVKIMSIRYGDGNFGAQCLPPYRRLEILKQIRFTFLMRMPLTAPYITNNFKG